MRCLYSILILIVIHWTLVDSYGSSGTVLPQVDEISVSLCSFFNNSQLNYSCFNEKEKSKSEINALETTEYLCGNYEDRSKGAECKNVSLLLLKFQNDGLCVASSPKNAEMIKQVFVKLPTHGVNHQHFMVCFNHGHALYNYTFSCATGIFRMTELLLTISGYDDSIGSVWTAMINVNITCTDTVDQDQEHKNKSLSMLEMMIGVGMISAIIIGGTVILTVVIVKVCNKRSRHNISRQLYAYTLLKNKLPSIQPHVPINSDDSDVSQPQTTVTGSDFQQANSIDSSTSVHQQDNSSEDTYIDALPKRENYIIAHSEAMVKSWMETTM